jgi:hypothetical protein
MLLTKPWTLLYNRYIEKEAEMLELFFVVLSFLVGRWMGAERANSVLDRSNIDELEAKILNAELRAETWERRYNNLLSTTQVSFEE